MWGHWYPFWTSDNTCPGFQSQGGFVACMLSCSGDPQIHLWCDTCWCHTVVSTETSPLGFCCSQHLFWRTPEVVILPSYLGVLQGHRSHRSVLPAVPLTMRYSFSPCKATQCCEVTGPTCHSSQLFLIPWGTHSSRASLESYPWVLQVHRSRRSVLPAVPRRSCFVSISLCDFYFRN